MSRAVTGVIGLYGSFFELQLVRLQLVRLQLVRLQLVTAAWETISARANGISTAGSIGPL
jgi:hypothetical protein